MITAGILPKLKKVKVYISLGTKMYIWAKTIEICSYLVPHGIYFGSFQHMYGLNLPNHPSLAARSLPRASLVLIVFVLCSSTESRVYVGRSSLESTE